MADINKVGAFVIKDKKVLVVRKKTHDFFIALGGRIETGENDTTCLTREVLEEIGCNATNIRFLATFEGPVHDDRTKTICMPCYLCDLEGEIKLNPLDSIVEYRWISRNYAKEGVKLAHTLETFVVPELIKRKLL